MVSAGPQAPAKPYGGPESASSTTTPLVVETFLSFPFAKKPSHIPSGEKKGATDRCVSGSGRASKSFNERIYNWGIPPRLATYATCSPLGEITTETPSVSSVSAGIDNVKRATLDAERAAAG